MNYKQYDLKHNITQYPWRIVCDKLKEQKSQLIELSQILIEYHNKFYYNFPEQKFITSKYTVSLKNTKEYPCDYCDFCHDTNHRNHYRLMFVFRWENNTPMMQVNNGCARFLHLTINLATIFDTYMILKYCVFDPDISKFIADIMIMNCIHIFL